MNKIISGKFSQRLNPVQIQDGWHNRISAEIMPLAQLHTTDGESFTMSFSSSWDVNNLRHSLLIEVHRIDPQCSVIWSDGRTDGYPSRWPATRNLETGRHLVT